MIRGSYTAPALEKGLDILELLSTQDIGLSQSEIARALGRSVGEIFRMLNVLHDRGYIALDPISDRYVLTTFLFEIANRIPKIRRLTTYAAPLMRSLVKVINQSVHLAITSNDNVLVVGQVDSHANNTIAVRLGAMIDIWQSSSGRAILAYLSEEDVARFLMDASLPKGLTERQIRADLAQIRREGIEIHDSFIVRGIVNISVPIIDHSGYAVAALTIPYIECYNDSITFDECRKELLKTAAVLSKSLGGKPPAVN